MKKYVVLFFFLAFPFLASTQNTHTVNEMKLKLNEDGSHFLKATFLNQVWFRFNDSNPGSLVQKELTNQTFDIGLRRTRMQFYGQLTDHVFLYTQFGQNNFNSLSQTSGNRKIQAFFHDALGEYKVWKDNDRLKLGGGLTITNGLSRFSQPSVGSIMTMDVPVFAQATVEQTDEFARKLSIYARGQLGRLDYRLVLSDPFPITTNGQTLPPPSSTANFAQISHTKQYQGFFMFNFLDKEPHTTPYMTGTYLGKKKILNLEAGFMTQQKAMWTTETPASDTVYHNMNLWSIALYYDSPINKEKGNALSAYAGFFNYDFGPNYLRYNGIMNPTNGLQTGYIPGSQGNSFPMFGTGKVVYAQLGDLFKRNLLGEGGGTLLPYVSVMRAAYDRLHDPMNVVDAGINWMISDHSSKLTLEYQSRPVYEQQGNDLVKVSARGQIVLQYQIYF